ncbi:MAG: hypothetical protein PHC70_04590 [Patescibacteria group bacterium]|nr:hypothetical protein [Patescibacteria group bacterium]
MPSKPWDDVIGHAQVAKLLDLWVERPAFSYLFYGPAHVGKATLAEKFVRALAGNTDLKDLNLHPDVVVFSPEEGKKDISVEQVRKNRLRLYQRPQISQRVVAFLPKLDRLNETGFNALLKVMEEPPADAVFVSVAENLARVPSTIISRTVCVPFGLVPQKEIQKALETRGMDAQEAEERSIICRGRPGLAIEPDESREAYVEAARQYARGSSAGHRLAASEKLRQLCESNEDVTGAWMNALETCMQVLRSEFSSKTRETLILAQGVADALACVGGAIQPRLLLDAAALQASRGRLSIPGLYPRYFPLSLS